jgi:hypothetical protein
MLKRSAVVVGPLMVVLLAIILAPLQLCWDLCSRRSCHDCRTESITVKTSAPLNHLTLPATTTSGH